MSTTARIAVKTAKQTILFNKRHDGYPNHTQEVLTTFLEDVAMNGMPTTAEEIETRLNKADYPDEKGYRPDIEIYTVTDREPITTLCLYDEGLTDFYYAVDLTDVTKQEPGTETPDQAASRFWDAIRKGPGETDDADIEAWLNQNTTTPDQREAVKFAITSTAEPSNLPFLTPRLDEDTIRELWKDASADARYQFNRAEKAEAEAKTLRSKFEMAEAALTDPDTGNTWEETVDELQDQIDDLQAASEAAEEERDRAREELAEAQNEALAAQRETAALKDEIQKTYITIANKEAKIEELKKALEAVEASRDQARAEASEARAEASKASEALVLLINHLTKIGQTNP